MVGSALCAESLFSAVLEGPKKDSRSSSFVLKPFVLPSIGPIGYNDAFGFYVMGNRWGIG